MAMARRPENIEVQDEDHDDTNYENVTNVQVSEDGHYEHLNLQHDAVYGDLWTKNKLPERRPFRVVAGCLGMLCFILLAVNIAQAVHYTSIQNQNMLLQKNLTGKTCTKPCASGWESDRGRCYFFSTNKLNWELSRNDCKQKGAELVKIESNLEQSFLQEKVKEKMAVQQDMFWIGLTDSKEEGKWVWSDGSPLDHYASFWSAGQPDNWKGNIDTGAHPDGEDCARMGLGSSDWTWFDQFCGNPHKYICEKQA